MANANMTIGATLGQTIYQTAMGMIINDNNPKKAIEFIQESLVGIPMEYIHGIIQGKYIITTDVENGNVTLEDNESEEWDSYPRTNLRSWIASQRATYKTEAEENLEYLRKFKENNRRGYLNSKGIIYSDIKACDLFNAVASGASSDELNVEYVDYSDCKIFHDTIKNFITKVDKFMSSVKFIREIISPENIINIQLGESYDDLLKEFQALTTEDGWKDSESQSNEMIDEHISAIQQIDNTNGSDFTNHPIEQQCNANWLSPDGKWYGMDGTSSCMLHIAIADLLREKGIIPPMDEEKIGSDYWLELNGWVRVHNNLIEYAGYNLPGKPSVPITDIQISEIIKYGNLFYNGTLEFGIEHSKITTTKLKAMEKPMFANIF